MDTSISNKADLQLTNEMSKSLIESTAIKARKLVAVLTVFTAQVDSIKSYFKGLDKGGRGFGSGRNEALTTNSIQVGELDIVDYSLVSVLVTGEKQMLQLRELERL